MVAYTKPQQRKKEESKRLKGEREQIKFIYLRFERQQAVSYVTSGIIHSEYLSFSFAFCLFYVREIEPCKWKWH